MSTGRWNFKLSEITRATKAVQATGLPVRNVEVTADGTIRVNIGEPEKARERPATDNEWDTIFENDDGEQA